MAELVYLHLEGTLSELEEMERVGLFNPSEIKTIIKKRKALEYKLRRSTKNKDDLLKYIEYEINLLALISKRRERLMIDAKSKEVDYTIAKRIKRLFRAATSRYPEDEKLWLDQIQFCKKMKWYESINTLHTRLLQVHSKSPDLWVMAAKWEMEEMRMPDNARKIMLRGIMVNPRSKLLWQEYFRLELMYTDIIRKRKEVLESANLKSSDGSELDAVYNAKVALVVYAKAIEEFDDVEFALQFLEICMDFDFTEAVVDHILKDIADRHPYDEQYLDAQSKRELLNIEKRIEEGKQLDMKKKIVLKKVSEEVCLKYEEAVGARPTGKMWGFYIDYVVSLLHSAKDTKKDSIKDKLLGLFERATEHCNLSLEHYLLWINILLEREDEASALHISLQAARQLGSVQLWCKAITCHIQSLRPLSETYDLLMEAVIQADGEESIDLWKLGVNWLSLSSPEKLMKFFEVGVTKCKELSEPLKAMYLESVAVGKGIESARALYKRLKKISPPSLAVVRRIVQHEKVQLPVSIEKLRKYYEDGVKEFGSCNVDIWLDYMMLELEHPEGNYGAYDMLLWRAKKTLDSNLVTELLERSMHLNTNNISENES